MATYEIRAMSTSEILDSGLGVFRNNFGTLAGISAACIGLPALLTVYVELAGGVLEHPVLYLFAALAYWVGGMLATGATIYAVSEFYLGRTPGISDSLAYARDLTGRIFVAGFCKYALIMLASLLLFVPGIILACGYAVVYQVVTLERPESGSSALGRSWDLTRGYKGTAFALGLVCFVLVYLPMMAGGFVAAFVPSLEAGMSALAQVVAVVLTPIMGCIFTLFYYTLRVRKEGFDVEILSRQLSVSATV